MQLDEIMAGIQSGMTGEWETDVSYLLEKCNQCKGHPLEEEILRGIGRLIQSILPEEQKKDIGRLNKAEKQQEGALIAQVSKMLKMGMLEEARALVEDKIALIADLYEIGTGYYSFHSLFESYLYLYLFEPEQEVGQTAYDYSGIYRVYGEILIEYDEDEQALTAFQTALQWNPIDMRALFSLGKCYRYMQEWEKAKETALEALRYVFTRAGVARCYRDLAAYYVHENQPVEAASLYFLSSAFHPTAKADREIQKLLPQAKEEIARLKADEVVRRVEDLGIQVGPSDDIFDAAQELCHLMEQNRQDSSGIQQIINDLLSVRDR